jgi:hypothetical protein
VVGSVYGIQRDPLRLGRRVGRHVELISTGFGVAPQVADEKLQRNGGRKGVRRRRGWSVTRPHATRRGSGTPRDPSRQRKGSPWSETRHDGDGEQLGARSKEKVSVTRLGWPASVRLYALACLRANAYTSWSGARAPRRKGCS